MLLGRRVVDPERTSCCHAWACAGRRLSTDAMTDGRYESGLCTFVAMRSRTVAAALTLASTLLLAGCGSTSPTVDPSPSTSVAAVSTTPPLPTPSPSPSPPAAEEGDVTVPPEPPAGLQGPPSEDAASDVAGYFHLLFPYIYATGDVSTWKELSADSCKYCAGVVKKVEAQFAEGKRHVGGRIEILEAVTYLHQGQQFVSRVTLREHPSKIVAEDGSSEVDVERAQDVRLEMLLSWTGERWLVDGVDIKYATPA